jgi:hypothetical protein
MNCNVRIAILLMEGGTGKSERQSLSLLSQNQVNCRAFRVFVLAPGVKMAVMVGMAVTQSPRKYLRVNNGQPQSI